jgi:hypothetical protein
MKEHLERAIRDLRARKELLVFVIAFAGICAACSSLAGHQTNVGVSGSTRGAESPADQEKQAVAAGWRAALDAVDVASRTSDPSNPMLAATHSGTQLARVTANIQAEKLNGWVASGTDKIVSVRVVRLTGNQARVIACVQGDEVEVNSRTLKPVLGEPGEAGPVSFDAQMVRSSGGWKIAHQISKQGPCGSS